MKNTISADVDKMDITILIEKTTIDNSLISENESVGRANHANTRFYQVEVLLSKWLTDGLSSIIIINDTDFMICVRKESAKIKAILFDSLKR